MGEEQRRKLSVRRKQLWRDPEYRARVLHGLKQRRGPYKHNKLCIRNDGYEILWRLIAGE